MYAILWLEEALSSDRILNERLETVQWGERRWMEMAPHISSTKLVETRPKALPGLAGLVMEALESVALFIDVIFFHNNVPMGVLPHPSEDVLVCNPAVSRFMSIFQVREQIISPAFELLEAPLWFSCILEQI